jgi:CheY-like chemotaxis protein
MPEIRPILLAEDNANDVELTLSALQAHNVANDVIVVRDGSEALDYLFRRGVYAERTTGDPALLLLDLKMPKMDGLEVLRHVKADGRMRRMPVVVLTSSREESDLVRSYDLGVNAYVVKPMNFPDFIHAVETLGAFWAVLNELPQDR